MDPKIPHNNPPPPKSAPTDSSPPLSPHPTPTKIPPNPEISYQPKEDPTTTSYDPSLAPIDHPFLPRPDPIPPSLPPISIDLIVERFNANGGLDGINKNLSNKSNKNSDTPFTQNVDDFQKDALAFLSSIKNDPEAIAAVMAISISIAFKVINQTLSLVQQSYDKQNRKIQEKLEAKKNEILAQQNKIKTFSWIKKAGIWMGAIANLIGAISATVAANSAGVAATIATAGAGAPVEGAIAVATGTYLASAITGIVTLAVTTGIEAYIEKHPENTTAQNALLGITVTSAILQIILGAVSINKMKVIDPQVLGEIASAIQRFSSISNGVSMAAQSGAGVYQSVAKKEVTFLQAESTEFQKLVESFSFERKMIVEMIERFLKASQSAQDTASDIIKSKQNLITKISQKI